MVSANVFHYIACDYDPDIPGSGNFNDDKTPYDGGPEGIVGPDQGVEEAYNVDTTWKTFGKTEIQNVGQPNSILTTTIDMPWPRMQHRKQNGLNILTTNFDTYHGKYVLDYSSSPWMESGDVTYGKFAQKWSVEVGTGPDPSVRVYSLLHIAFPYAPNDTVWYSAAYFALGAPSTHYIDLVTPYEKITISTDSSETKGGYRGWLHLSDGVNLLQGFFFGETRYLYLNGQKKTSLIGVPINDIQTVLFDIPVEAINRFK